MRLLYVKPELSDLSQGSRIAFIRQLRHISQDYVAEKLGITSKSRRRTLTRYEKGDRNPLDCRTKKIAEILKISYYAVKPFDFKNPIELIYFFFWMEEYIPNYRIDLSQVNNLNEYKMKYIIKALTEWKQVKIQRDNHEISYEEYLEWKFNFSMKGESNNE